MTSSPSPKAVPPPVRPNMLVSMVSLLQRDNFYVTDFPSQRPSCSFKEPHLSHRIAYTASTTHERPYALTQTLGQKVWLQETFNLETRGAFIPGINSGVFPRPVYKGISIHRVSLP